MKIHLDTRYWLATVFITVMVGQRVIAQPKQDWKELGKQKLAQMDVSGMKTGHLLNLGLFQKKTLD